MREQNLAAGGIHFRRGSKIKRAPELPLGSLGKGFAVVNVRDDGKIADGISKGLAPAQNAKAVFRFGASQKHRGIFRSWIETVLRR